MNDEQMKSLWTQGKQEEPKMNLQAINSILEKSVRTGWSCLRLNVSVFVCMLAVALIFDVLNVIGYATNPAWLTVHAGLTAVTLAFMTLSLHVKRDLRSLDDPSVGLAALVRRQLKFFHTTFEWWLWVAAVTTWVLSFSISVWVANQHDHYRIKSVVEFIAVSAAMIFGSYALFRLGHYPMIQRTLAALHDLEAQATEKTLRVQGHRKYWVIALVVLVVVLTVSVVLTIMAWLARGGGL